MNQSILAFAKACVKHRNSKKLFPMKASPANREWIVKDCERYIEAVERVYDEKDCFTRFNLQRRIEVIEDRLKTYVPSLSDK